MPVKPGKGAIGREIKSLQDRPDYSHERAVAASLNMARKGDLGRTEKRKAAGRAPSRGSR
jgi:hypothetical protein